MVGDRYKAEDDPACYPGTSVLRNLPDLQDQAELEKFEVEAVGTRSLVPPPEGLFDPTHYRALHHHLFQDVYAWAGEYRTIRTGKGGNWFCYPDHIDRQMKKLFGELSKPVFVAGGECDVFVIALAEFLGELNAIHPFREGNGRTQLIFARLLGLRAGCALRTDAVEAEPFLAAMIESFNGGTEPLIDELERMLA